MAGSDNSQRLFGVLLARNEVDLLRANVLYHLWMGCERVIVIDNGSTDGSRRILRRLARNHPVDWTRDDGDYHQAELVTAMAQEARAKGADWVIPLDVDEFWYAWEPLQPILVDAAQRGVGALEVERREFVQARDQRRSTMAGSRRARWRVEHPLRGNQAVAEFVSGERSMFELAPPPKWLMRTTAELEIAKGGHTAEGLAGLVEVRGELSIFHLAMRSRKRALGRIGHAERVAQVDDRPNISVQNRYWQMMAARGQLEEAWRAHSYEDGVLDVFGRRVELIEDTALAEVLAPYALSRFRQWTSDTKRTLKGARRRS